MITEPWDSEEFDFENIEELQEQPGWMLEALEIIKAYEKVSEEDKKKACQELHKETKPKSRLLEEPTIKLLFSKGFNNERDRVFFGIMLFTGCRLNEVCALETGDVYDESGLVRDGIIVRNKKTLKTRIVPVCEPLRELLSKYSFNRQERYLFPSESGGHIQSKTMSIFLKKACEKVGIVGADNNIFRRTMVAQMMSRKTPFRS
ncbi:MAG: tyrosine-type recombinase/integrase [Crocosphaera sp.]|nr:tyrosine-type recombinase/integrase [Crocosphaera sp.]